MSIISDIFAGGLSGILSPITNMVTAIYTKKEDTALEKFKVDGKVDVALVQAEVELGKARIDLLKNKWIVGLQVGFGLPLMVYYGKCILWDKVFALGSTDPLGGDIGTYSMWIVGFLFAHSVLDSWGRKT